MHNAIHPGSSREIPCYDGKVITSKLTIHQGKIKSVNSKVKMIQVHYLCHNIIIYQTFLKVKIIMTLTQI